MKNLVYDNLYKFLVSLGIILIVLPIAGMIFFYNTNSVLINQEEYDLLSEVSKNALLQRESIYSMLIHFPRWIAYGSIILGIILFVIGLCNWAITQRILDTKLKAEAKKATLEADCQEMTKQEIKRKIIKEEDESKSSIINGKVSQEVEKEVAIDEYTKNKEQDDRNIIDSEESQKGKKEQFWIERYLQAEELLFSYTKRIYGYDYSFKNNVRIDEKEYDAIGISRMSDIDIIAEFRYVEDYSSRILDTLSWSIGNLQKTRKKYSKETKRNSRGILLIATTEKMYDYCNEKTQNFIDKNRDMLTDIEIQVYDINTLKKIA